MQEEITRLPSAKMMETLSPEVSVLRQRVFSRLLTASAIAYAVVGLLLSQRAPLPALVMRGRGQIRHQLARYRPGKGRVFPFLTAGNKVRQESLTVFRKENVE